MGVFHILALVAAALPARVFATDRFIRGSLETRRTIAYLSALLLVVTSAAFEFLFYRAVLDSRAPSVLARLPLWFPNVHGASITPAGADGLLFAGLLETAALGVFLAFFAAFGKRERSIVTLVVAAALAAAALVTPAIESNDPYLYVGLATLGRDAYQPPNTSFPGDLHVINRIWGRPLLPSAYGPVWVAFSALYLSAFATLGAKLFALKLLGLAAVAACASLSRRIGAAPSVVAGIACNPGIYFTFVAGAHNDLFAVDLVLLAMLAARRSVVFAFVCALAACFVKITLVPVAVIAAAGLRPLRSRLAFAGLLVAIVGVAYLADGALLLHAVFAAIGTYAAPPPVDRFFRFPLALIGLANALGIVVAARNRAQTGWAPPAFGDAPLPHYFVWGLPLVLRSTPIALAFLVSLPALMLLSCPVLPVTSAYMVVSVFVVTVAGVVAIVRFRVSVRGRAGSDAAI